MKRLVCLAAALCLFVSGALPSARAEITLPPDVMEHATEGINGVYSLDFDTAQKILNSFFRTIPTIRSRISATR